MGDESALTSIGYRTLVRDLCADFFANAICLLEVQGIRGTFNDNKKGDTSAEKPPEQSLRRQHCKRNDNTLAIVLTLKVFEMPHATKTRHKQELGEAPWGSRK